MQTRDELFFEDERELAYQQKLDHEAHEQRLTDILRRLAEGVLISKDDVIALCVGCGIDKRNVF